MNQRNNLNVYTSIQYLRRQRFLLPSVFVALLFLSDTMAAIARFVLILGRWYSLGVLN